MPTEYQKTDGLPFLTRSNEYETAPQSNKFFQGKNEEGEWFTHIGDGLHIGMYTPVWVRRRDGSTHYYRNAFVASGWTHRLVRSPIDIVAYKIDKSNK